MVAGVIAGLIALRWGSLTLTADITVTAYAALTLGWLLMSLLVFGVDETVDPARFALLPVRARELLPGLLVCGLVGVPGAATVLISLGLIVTWARSVPLTLAAVIAAGLGLVTCVLLSRVATSGFAAFLASRRFRDLALIALALVGAGFGVAGNLIGTLIGPEASRFREGLAAIATIAGWTPFGWAWAIPADVARGDWLVAVVHLVLAAGLVVGGWSAWGHLLAVRLTSPIEGGSSSAKVTNRRAAVSGFRATPAGGVAVRDLKYWRRDPRYLAGIAGFLVAPVIIIVTQLANPYGSPLVAALAPVLLGLVAGATMAQDLSYDGSSVWLHVTTGLRGADDRWGRIVSSAVIYLPLVLVVVLMTSAATGRWDLLPVVAGLTVTLTLTGLGAGALVGTLWQWPAPPPGASPFQKGNSGGLPALASYGVTLVGTLLGALPAIGLALGSIAASWLAWLVLPVGMICGALAVWVGVVRGGRILDRRWPEVLGAVSERTG